MALEKLVTSWSIAGALFVVAPWVSAQEAIPLQPRALPSAAAQNKEDAPAGAVPVSVTSYEGGLVLTVAQPGRPQAIVSCYQRCSFWAVPGAYTLWATSPEIHYQTTLQVRTDSDFRVSPGHPGERTAGLIAGIVGPIAMVGGAAMFLSQLFGPNYQCNESNCPSGKPNVVGPALFLVGLVATPVGWVIFAMSGPRVDALHDGFATREPTRAPHLQLGVLALPRGWGAGLSTQF